MQRSGCLNDIMTPYESAAVVTRKKREFRTTPVANAKGKALKAKRPATEARTRTESAKRHSPTRRTQEGWRR